MINKQNTEVPLYLFHQGTNSHSYKYMGANFTERGTVVFRVWAPNAKAVSVVGSFNNWNSDTNVMERISEQGLFETEIEGVNVYDSYKYKIFTPEGDSFDKSDPYAFHTETRPANASKVYDIYNYKWNDSKWIEKREKTNPLHSPMNIYELHLSSWRTYPDGQPFNYRQIADELSAYVADMGYTHVEIMPVTEYPFDGSWGYQVTGYFAPTSRFGTPDDFKYFVDKLHSCNIGIIMDWVPAHFPKDANGLARFDGKPCYEYESPLKGEHKEWGTYAFDYGRNEVISFLTSSAVFWIEEYHLDGIRVDAVASMLYLDYGRNDGEWQPNINGGNENLEAVALLQNINKMVLSENKGVMMIAEESTAWPMVTKPDFVGGLGFTFKWNMGWMNDSLTYASMDPYFRSFNHDKLTFGMYYAFSENFILPVSHDEVVHGKASLINKMPGDYEEKFAGLRAFLGYMMSFPGKKLLFMGSEFGQFIEWNFAQELDWVLLDYDSHRKTRDFVKAINHYYKDNSEFWQIEDSWDGFRWLNADDNTRNVFSYLRTNEKGEQKAVVLNFAPVKWEKYILGLPENITSIKVDINSDWVEFGGKSEHSEETYRTRNIECGEFKKGVEIDIPPLSAIYFTVRKKKEKKPVLKNEIAKETKKTAKKEAAKTEKKEASEKKTATKKETAKKETNPKKEVKKETAKKSSTKTSKSKK